MNIKQIQQDICKGEGLHLEFKEAKDSLPRNFFETVCAFLNTDGGTIFLGVADDGKVIGVDQDAISRMRSDIANLSNNPQKIVQHHFGEITLENLRPFSRNPSICKFMIQLGRFDELGSGVTNINKYLPLYAHGAKPVFKETRHGFELIVPLDAKRAEPQPESQPESLEQRVLSFLNSQPLSKAEISLRLGQKEVSGQLNKVIRVLISQGLIEYTLPDKPNSRLQKYCLTQRVRPVSK